ncbi:MAG: hypothetical protein RLN88_04315 [Ekhidna sp.]|uniref:hypothetical protein n=1 Tax=Ekhidna sp. TaxID=2608089 RepID=UPI0032EDE588
MRLNEFLEESGTGRFSNARLANLIVVSCFGADWIMHIVRALDFNPSFTIVGIVAAVMGIKVAQKRLEK